MRFKCSFEKERARDFVLFLVLEEKDELTVLLKGGLFYMQRGESRS